MALAVSVFGLGYVGCVSAACLAKEGHHVIGVDVSESKVAMVNAGTATIVEEGIGELVAGMRAANRLEATTDAADAVQRTGLSLVCVGTPSRANGSLELTYVERVCEDIGRALRQKARPHVVVIRSTVLPGTTEEVVVPVLERASGLVAGRDFGIAMNPEFLREGSSIRDFYDPPFTIIGAGDAATAQQVSQLYAGLQANVHVVAPRVAEMVKYACNCYHGLKVGFANEVGNVCKTLGVDSHEVMRIFCEDTKLNISASYLRPGFAFGGSCLPKDLRAVIHRAKSLDVATPILEATLVSNEKQIERAYRMAVTVGRRRVGVLGLAFKHGTDDLRESPMVALIERLVGRGYQVAIYDRDVSEARLLGANREYIERELPHIWSLLRASMHDVLAESETIIIGNGAPEFRDAERLLGANHVVIDLVRMFGNRVSDDQQYHGICW